MIRIKGKGQEISDIVVTTFMGHSGGRIFDLPAALTGLSPAYRRLTRMIMDRGVTIMAKSSTYLAHQGNFDLYNPGTWKYIRKIERGHGMLNSYGLTNLGVLINARRICAAIDSGYNVIPNFFPQFSHGQEQAISETVWATETYARILESRFWALELNLSCPNTTEQIKSNMANSLALIPAVKREHPQLVLIAKVSVVHSYDFVRALVKAGVDIIHAVNAIPYDLVYNKKEDSPSPLADVGGGAVSGEPAYKLAFDFNSNLRRAVSHAPLILGCGVMHKYQAGEYFEAGAGAVSLCTVCRLDPIGAADIINHFS